MSLTAIDLDRHRALGIPPELLEQAGVRRVTDYEARELLGLNGQAGNFAGLVYPYVAPGSRHRVTARLRLDHPPVRSDGRPDGKYRAPYGDNRHLYFVPGTADLLPDVTAPVVFVEPEKGALALTAAAERQGRRLLPIAMGGCWGWRGRIGKAEDADGARVDVKGPLPDFDRVTWTGRDAIVLLDARPNDSVQAARRALARELEARGAIVRHAHLPDDDPTINGPDDFVGARGPAALFAVLDAAVPADFERTTHGSIIATSLDNVRLALQRLTVRPMYDGSRGKCWCAAPCSTTPTWMHSGSRSTTSVGSGRARNCSRQ